MTLTQATSFALAALEAGDLDALAQALTGREAALHDASDSDKTAALVEGETLRLRLATFKHALAAEYSQLARLRAGASSYSGTPLPSSGLTVRS